MKATISYDRRDSDKYPCKATINLGGVKITEIANTYAEAKNDVISKAEKLIKETDFANEIPEPEEVELSDFDNLKANLDAQNKIKQIAMVNENV